MRQGTASRRHGMRSKGGATAHPDCWNDPLADEISRRSPRPVHWRQSAKPRPIGLEELTFFRASSAYGVRANDLLAVATLYRVTRSVSLFDRPFRWGRLGFGCFLGACVIAKDVCRDPKHRHERVCLPHIPSLQRDEPRSMKQKSN
jgi:hypothetical protein